MWSPTVTITPPTAEPVTKEAVKTFCRLDGSALDQQLDGFIAAARTEIENTTGTRLVEQTVECRASSFADLDALPIGPVLSIVSVEYLDPAGAEQAVSAGFLLVGAGLAWSIRRLPGAGSWPAALAVPGAIRVRLKVGYGAPNVVPPDLWLAMLQLVRGMVDDEPADIDHLLVNRRIWA